MVIQHVIIIALVVIICKLEIKFIYIYPHTRAVRGKNKVIIIIQRAMKLIHCNYFILRKPKKWNAFVRLNFVVHQVT